VLPPRTPGLPPHLASTDDPSRRLTWPRCLTRPPSMTSAARLTQRLRAPMTPPHSTDCCHPRRPSRHATAPIIRNPGDPSDRPALDPASRPRLPALVAPVGHLFNPRPLPYADHDAAVNFVRSQSFQILYFE
jgi:hypothetical protein